MKHIYSYEQKKQAQELLESCGFYHTDFEKTGGVVGIWDQGNEFWAHTWKHDDGRQIVIEIPPEGTIEFEL